MPTAKKTAAEDSDSGSPPRTRPRPRPITKPALRRTEASGTGKGVSDPTMQADSDASIVDDDAGEDEVIEEGEEEDEIWDELLEEEVEEVEAVKAKATTPGM